MLFIMNHIEAKLHKSKFAAKEHLDIFIDGIVLDKYLESKFRHDYILDLVPSLTWLLEESDRVLAASLLACEKFSRQVAPVLVCPDDQDFSCTVIVVEVEFSVNEVKWHRAGLCKAGHGNDVSDPRKTEWFEPKLGLRFYSEEYMQCLKLLSSESY